MNEELLHGGVANAGAVVRVGEHVLRPAPANHATLHALLRYVRAAGFDGVPEPVGIDADGRERLRFIPGDVAYPPYPVWAQSDDALASIAELLRRYHDATVGFVPPVDAAWSPEMADHERGRVIGHNDVCLENVVFRGGRAVALLDFDYAAPARRSFDVAAMARMCVPVDGPEDASRFTWEPNDVPARLGIVADAYGLDTGSRREVLEVLDHTMAVGGQFLQRRVAEGHPAFIAMWEEMGGMARYDRRRAWYAANRDGLARALSVESGAQTDAPTSRSPRSSRQGPPT